MATPIVSMDEAGQTGQNLLDPEQPVFTLASVDLDEDEAVAIIGRAEEELHFVRAKRNARGRAQVVDLLSALPADRVKAVVINKPFMVTCKIIDQLVEPMMHDDGIDGHADGSLLALANLWHFACDACVGPSVLSDLHRLFVQAVHRRDSTALDEFYERLGAAITGAKVQVPAMQEMWLSSRVHFVALMEEQPLPLLEPGLPAAQALVGLPRGEGTSELACFDRPGRMFSCPSPIPRSSVTTS